jgi:hypothetical protein
MPGKLEATARSILAGVGDAELGEWLETKPRVVHLRRRLSAREAAEVGPVVDIRGTPDAVARIAALGPLVRVVPEHVLTEELGTHDPRL